MNEGTARQYGPRDAASVLMYHRRKVALVDGKRWVLDGKPVSYRQLEDAAELYERLRNRITEGGLKRLSSIGLDHSGYPRGYPGPCPNPASLRPGTTIR